MKQSKITKSARGEDCQIRVPGICNFNPETTVFCHLNGGGMGTKHSDLHGAYGCSNCHDAIDGRLQTDHSWHELKKMHLEAMVRTQNILVDKGLITINGQPVQPEAASGACDIC